METECVAFLAIAETTYARLILIDTALALADMSNGGTTPAPPLGQPY